MVPSALMSARFVAAIDQGTTSSRCMLFDAAGAVAAVAQKEHRQIYPRPGWVEHDAEEIWANVAGGGRRRAGEAGATPADIAAVGITNQRETTVVWEKASGRPIANAIVWQDTRTDKLVAELGGEAGQDRFRAACGLPLATYFSGPKLRWLLDATPGARARGRARRAAVRHHRRLADLEADRPPRHRRHQRLAHHADEPGDAGLGRRRCWRRSACRAPCCPRSGRRRRSTGRRGARWRACRWPPRSATSRRRCSARPASRLARASAPTAPAASCWSTPARGRWPRRTACSPRSATSSPASRRSTRWRARSR